jgi:hypothetical protein
LFGDLSSYWNICDGTNSDADLIWPHDSFICMQMNSCIIRYRISMRMQDVSLYVIQIYRMPEQSVHDFRLKKIVFDPLFRYLINL